MGWDKESLIEHKARKNTNNNTNEMIYKEVIYNATAHHLEHSRWTAASQTAHTYTRQPQTPSPTLTYCHRIVKLLFQRSLF